MDILRTLVVGNSAFTIQACDKIQESGHEIGSIISSNSQVINWATQANITCYQNIHDISTKPNLVIYVDYKDEDKLLNTIDRKWLNIIAFATENPESTFGWYALSECHCIEPITFHSNNRDAIQLQLLDDLYDILTSFARQQILPTANKKCDSRQLHISKSEFSRSTSGLRTLLALVSVIFARYRSDKALSLFFSNTIIPNGVIPSQLSGISLISPKMLTKLSEIEKAQAFTEQPFVTLGFSETPPADSKGEIIMSANEATLTIQETVDSYLLNLNFKQLPLTYFFAHLSNMIDAIKVNAEADLWATDMISSDEKERMAAWNTQGESISFEKNIIQVFDENLPYFLNRTAIIYQDKKWTYQELNSEITKVSFSILQTLSSTKQGLKIAIAVDRGLPMVAGLFGILKAGGMYVPLDSAYPVNRIQFILDDTKPDALIIDKMMQEKMPWLIEYTLVNKIPLVSYETNSQLAYQDTLPSINQNSNAYTIYTSGTTGKPKGVVIKHLSIVNLAKSFQLQFDITPDANILCVASIGFDAAGWDIYGAILNGATLVIADEAARMDTQKLFDFINYNKVTLATLTPAVVKLLPKSDLPALNTLIIMGDSGDEDMFLYWSAQCTVFNGYGPTETTIAATLNQYYPGDKINCIGKPLHNYSMHIIDSYNQLVPPGVVGELCISGPCVANGYLHLDKETNDKFVSCHFTNQPYHQIMYKTGDYATWQENGTLQFRGRRDQQVKILGVRIEIGDLEQTLIEHPAINQAVVIVITNQHDKRLACFYTNTTAMKTDENELTLYMRERFHPAVVPSQFILLDSMPLTVNGKIDKKLLEEYPILIDADYVAPRDNTERFLCQLFMDVLSHEQIGIYDNFFQHGGHSLSAAQITARINDHFNTESLKISALFNHPTPIELAQFIGNLKPGKDRHIQPIDLTSREGPLTSAQQRLWFLYQYDPDNCAYNLPIILRFTGNFSISTFNTALQHLVKRHESLRTIIQNRSGEGVQKVIDWEFTPLSPVLVSESDLETHISKLIKSPFDIEQEVCWRQALFKLGENDYVYVSVKHNLITDAWSEGLLIRELNQLYTEFAIKQESTLPTLTQHQLDHAYYEIAHMTVEHLHNAITYWKNKLAHYTDTLFPTDYSREMTPSDAGYRLHHVFKNVDVNAVHAVAKQKNITPFMIYLTALKILLYRYTGQLDVTIGTATSGRMTSAVEKMTGFFVNTIPLRSQFTHETTTDNAFDIVKKTCLEAYDHQELPFDWLVDQVNARRELNKSPIFQIMMILQNANEGFSLTLPEVSCEIMSVQTQTTMFDMSFNFVENGNQLQVDLDYSTKLFRKETILSLISHYETLLTAIINDSTAPISLLTIFTKPQQDKLLKFCNGPTHNFAQNSIINMLQKTVKTYPENIALITDADKLTYSELFTKISELSQHLLAQPSFAHSRRRVAIILDRNTNLIIGLLSVIMAGGTYIPIDPEYPQDRIAYMLKDSEADCILTEKMLASEVDSFGAKISTYLVEDASCQSNKHPNVPLYNNNESLYTIYTSGTTGLPKGVSINQTSVCNIVCDFISMLDCKPHDVLMSITTVSFDIFVLEYLMPLLSGATLLLCNRELSRDPVRLVNFINEIQPTIIQATPTLWNMIVDHLLPQDNQLKIISGGEALPPKIHKKLCPIAKEVWNVYGPTETTIWSTSAEVKNSPTLTIGKPIANTTCYVLDEHNQLVPQGGLGELHIGGAGVAQGYWMREALTTEKFITVEFCKPEKVYKTGDLVRLNHDGNLEYYGRKDLQVKIRGNRIELSEIEAVISQYPGIDSTVVSLIGDGDDKVLIAYYILENKDLILSQDELHQFLSEKLPTAMLPSAYMALEQFPMTHNRKIDRKNLPVPEKEFGNRLGRYVQPSTVTEQVIQTMWEEVLKIKRISITDNFFMVGGNSLHIPMIVMRLNDHFATKLTLRDFILNSTIQANANIVVNHCEKLIAEVL